MKNFNLEKFGGINQKDPANKLGSNEATNALNVRLDKENAYKRPWTTEVWTLWWSGSVHSSKTIRGHLIVIRWTVAYRWADPNWVATGLTWLTDLAKSILLEFPVLDWTDDETWTVTEVWDNWFFIKDSAKSWTPNAYVWKFVKITSWTWQYQVRKITANTATELFVVERFNEDPNWNFAIQDSTNWNYFFNWSDQPKTNKNITWTTWTNISNISYFKYAITYQNRIIWCPANSSTIYISTLLNWEDYPFEIVVWEWDGLAITWIKRIWNQLVIHKWDQWWVWISEFIDPTQAEFLQRTENFWAIEWYSIDVWENIMFYISDRGIEWFNTLETNMLEWHKALSDYRIPTIRDADKTTTAWIAFDWKYYATIGTTTYIFDISLYLQYFEENRRKPYVFLKDTWYSPLCFAVLDWELYMWTASKVLKVSGTTDDWNAITAYWEKDWIDLKQPERVQALRRVWASTSWWTSDDTITITASSETETKALTTFPLTKNFNKVDWKRVRWNTAKIKFDLSDIWSAKLEKAQLIFEEWKI